MAYQSTRRDECFTGPIDVGDRLLLPDPSAKKKSFGENIRDVMRVPALIVIAAAGAYAAWGEEGEDTTLRRIFWWENASPIVRDAHRPAADSVRAAPYLEPH